MLGTVHYLVPQRKEPTWFERFSEEICMVICGGHIRDNKASLFHKFSNEVMAPVYVLGARVVLRII